jgi:hypothetical protein
VSDRETLPEAERFDIPYRAPRPDEDDPRALRQLSYRLRVFDLVMRDIIGPGEGRSYVDLGAGPLLFAQRARDAGFRVTAVDARPPWTGRVPNGVATVLADIRRFDLAGYDVIGIVGLLYHLRLPEQLDLLDRCAGRPTIVDTEVYCPDLAAALGLVSPRLRSAETHQGYDGATLAETGDIWSSHGNAESFWPTEASLLAMFAGRGWRRVTALEPPYLSRFGRRRWYVLR